MAAPAKTPTLVCPQWLAERLGDPAVKVFDCSWYLPPMGRSAAAEYTAARIPGAGFFDIDGVCLPGTDLPHMLPTEQQFGGAMDALGVTAASTVVLYDGLGTFASPRAWWTFRVFGHHSVCVLEGGLPAWKAAGQQLEESAPAAEALTLGAAAVKAAAAGQAPKYQARLQADKVRSVDQMLTITSERCAKEQVVDARPAGRFAGKDPEPRASLRGGHMPGAKNVPFVKVYKDGQMTGAQLLPPAELAGVFTAAGVALDQPLVCSCGSGLTAAVLALALHEVTGKLMPVYDGSWTEWGGRQDTPIEVGA